MKPKSPKHTTPANLTEFQKELVQEHLKGIIKSANICLDWLDGGASSFAIGKTCSGEDLFEDVVAKQLGRVPQTQESRPSVND